MKKVKINLPLRPARHVEHFLVTSILSGTYPQRSALPNERALAEQLGVTRPTLRETLQRLANEGWIKIQHGKPTRVNDFWQDGGLSLLSTLAKYADHLPNGFITHLLEVRAALLPSVARIAAKRHPKALSQYLVRATELTEDAASLAEYDWNLQMLMARHSSNPIFSLILNDFASMFKTMAGRYFSRKEARLATLVFYRKLLHAVSLDGEAAAKVVEDAMQESIAIWQKIKPK